MFQNEVSEEQAKAAGEWHWFESKGKRHYFVKFEHLLAAQQSEPLPLGVYSAQKILGEHKPSPKLQIDDENNPVVCGVKIMGNMVWFMDSSEPPRQVTALERKLITALQGIQNASGS